jgi:hypothetical protein
MDRATTHKLFDWHALWAQLWFHDKITAVWTSAGNSMSAQPRGLGYFRRRRCRSGNRPRGVVA